MTKKTPTRARPQNLVGLVKQAMAMRGITTNALAERLAGRVTRATVYNWLGGRSKSIRSDSLAEIFAALFITVSINREAE